MLPDLQRGRLVQFTQPGSQGAVVKRDRLELCRAVAGGGGDARTFDGKGAEHALAEVIAEFEAVEEVDDSLGISGPELELVRAVWQGQVLDHFGDVTVQLDVCDALAKVVADFAADFVGVIDEVFQCAVLNDPLRRGFLADPWNAREIVGGVATEGRKVRVLSRR